MSSRMDISPLFLSGGWSFFPEQLANASDFALSTLAIIAFPGNFVGCLILSVIFVLAGASGTADYYAGFIGNKLSIPAGEMFFRAILCNFFVCLAVPAA